MFSKKEKKRFENKFIENLDFGTIIVLVDKKNWSKLSFSSRSKWLQFNPFTRF